MCQLFCRSRGWSREDCLIISRLAWSTSWKCKLYRTNPRKRSPTISHVKGVWPTMAELCKQAELELLRDIQIDDPRVLGCVSSDSLMATNLTSQSQGVPAIMVIRNLDETTGNDTNWPQYSTRPRGTGISKTWQCRSILMWRFSPSACPPQNEWVALQRCSPLSGC